MNRYTIDLFDETEQLTDVEKNLVADVLNTALKEENLKEESEVSVTFVTDEHIHQLNREYRDKDQPTDVLSFALNEGDEDISESPATNLLGDVIISVPRAKVQAEEYGHDMKRELCFLAVHGFLHLIGYDHETEKDEKVMFTKQEDILQKHGLKK
ncbi:rRNA maturation RNase YbeY [Salipaludibacillus agaradhaerens]|uniref:Endoribonuclease YbeY n=1 Tax=Salipaludibacillus agaradhaerens TaxID=76935 RepID=A0A9Q4FYX1_SALAG|nr:rRNA maturation RNase YbeY [Salipaludibacillus agaradhaerens]MCR6096781.1 rRNA maturation RNase YbeY [Salipaludibacillus agaradhaerens]MCR6113660.1 rRNA maturation RNase YbeY [Salipaludibacillus agaradhaerens]